MEPQLEPNSKDDEFVRLMTSSQRALRAYLIGLVPHSVDADDLLQEVNMALWRKRHLYDSGQEFLRWAFGFAALEVRSFRSRSAKNQLWLSETAIESLSCEWPSTERFLEDCGDYLAICLRKLGSRERSVIDGRYGNQLSVKQIAANNGQPLSTVYKILNRAIESLRECIKRSQLQSSHG